MINVLINMVFQLKSIIKKILKKCLEAHLGLLLLCGLAGAAAIYVVC